MLKYTLTPVHKTFYKDLQVKNVSCPTIIISSLSEIDCPEQKVQRVISFRNASHHVNSVLTNSV